MADLTLVLHTPDRGETMKTHVMHTFHSVFTLLCAATAFGADATIYEDWPFDAAEAARRQTETSQATKHPIALKTPLAGNDGPTLTWRLIPAGKFIIGSPEGEPGHEGDERQRPEIIAQPFYMMETQMTVEQYRALMQADPSDQGPHRLWRYAFRGIGRQWRAPGEHHDQRQTRRRALRPHPRGNAVAQGPP